MTNDPYRAWLWRAAKGVPCGPFHAWQGTSEALYDVGMAVWWTIVGLLMILTYPISVPIIARIAQLNYERGMRRLDEADREWRRDFRAERSTKGSKP